MRGRRWELTACAALALLVVLVVVVRFARDHWGGVYDDALIYLRYVKNLRAGCGPRFNCDGPRVEGFTSPVYLAVLWLGSLVTTQLIDLCQVVCTASVVLVIVAAGGLAVRLGPEEAPRVHLALGAATVLALVLDHDVLLNSITGMETAFTALVVTAIVLAACGERPWLLVAAAGFGVVTRPELGVFCVALPLLPMMRRPRYLIAIAGVVIAMTVVRFALFGAVLPNTFYAKAGGTWRHFELGAAYLVDCARDFPLIVLAPLALLTTGPRRKVCVFVLAATAVWFAFFLRTGGDTFVYSRLAFPLVPVLSALAFVGIAALATRSRLVAAHAPMIAVLAVALLVGVRAAVSHAIPPQHANPRVLQWAAAGNYLRAHHKGELVATVPIGAIGYYSQSPVLDLVGLTEPVIAHAGRTVPPELLTKDWIGHERHFTEYVLDQKPKVIVTTMVRDQPWRDLAEARAGFFADWLLVQEIKAGRAPYHVEDAALDPQTHLLMFVRDP